jgi:hypothetical protein
LVSRGFVRFSNGSFSAPIVDPNDTVNVTEGRGINNSRTVCGDYVGSDGNFHGFFLSRGTFTEYDIAGAPAPSTLVPGINDPADFAGAFSLTGPNGIHQGFVSVAFVMSSESLALSEVEWVETSLDVVVSPIVEFRVKPSSLSTDVNDCDSLVNQATKFVSII